MNISGPTAAGRVYTSSPVDVVSIPSQVAPPLVPTVTIIGPLGMLDGALAIEVLGRAVRKR
jgi:hypothetical protein